MTMSEGLRRAMLCLALSGALAGCATVDGIGRDISAGAQRASGWF